MRRTDHAPFDTMSFRDALRGLMELPWSAPLLVPVAVPGRRGR